MSGTRRMFLGLVAGAVGGAVLARCGPTVADRAVAFAEPLGTLWLSGLQMTVLPLVVSLLITGVTQAADVAATGRMARRALAWILTLSTAAALLAAGLAPALLAVVPRPAGLMSALDGAPVPAGTTPATGVTAATALVPRNVVAAAAAGAVAPVVVFTLCFALALATLAPARRAPVVAIAEAVAEAMTTLVGWVLRAGPVGVAALILPVAVRAGGGVLGALAAYVGLLVTVYLVVTALLYLLVRAGRGVDVRRFAVAALPAQVVAASTQSSLASLPAMLESARRLGCPAAVSGLVLPLAVSLFRITSPAQYVAVVSFIAWAQGVELAAGSLAVAVLMSVAISLGAVGLPGQASFMGTVLPVVQAAGLPVEPLGMLLAVDLVPDVFATVGNVTGDLAITSRIARAEG